MAGEAQLEAALTGIMTRLEDDSVLGVLAPGGVHLETAPQGTHRPYVTVRPRPGGWIESTLGDPRAMRYVNVEVLGRVDGAGSVASMRIDERIDVLLADYLPSIATPWSVAYCRRLYDVSNPTVDDGTEVDQRGGLYRLGLSGG